MRVLGRRIVPRARQGLRESRWQHLGFKTCEVMELADCAL
jgi:hypothetical protein